MIVDQMSGRLKRACLASGRHPQARQRIGIYLFLPGLYLAPGDDAVGFGVLSVVLSPLGELMNDNNFYDCVAFSLESSKIGDDKNTYQIDRRFPENSDMPGKEQFLP